MTALVIGGTGRTGAWITRELIARGVAVRVYGRSAAPDTVPEGATPIAGDALDRAGLDRALDGVDAVVVSLSIPRASASPFAAVTGPADLHSRSAEALIAAMQARWVRRVVKISAIGVGPTAPLAGWGFRALVAASNLAPAFADHARADERFAASTLDWTIAHPPRLTDGPPTGAVEAGEGLSTGTFTGLPRADLARWVADVLPDPAWHRRRITVRPGGPPG